MATKVKGESIKEGSVPFSALENFNYDLSNEADYAKFKNALENEKAGFIITQNDIINNVYIIFTQNVGGNFYYLRGIDRTKAYETTIDISNNPTIIFRKKDEIDIIIPIDWNAQPGEAGYIENKPITKNFIKEQSMEFNEVDEWTSIYEGYDEVPSNTTVAKVFADITTDRGEHFITTVIVQNGSSVELLENDEDHYLTISMYNTSEGLTMNVGASFGFSGTLRCYYYEEFKQLDEDYIPDIVIKTTPQTLSDTDKNQALTNLGIDPVVWKYLCNPCIIKEDEAAPNDLLGKNGNIDDKYVKCPGMFRKYNDSGVLEYIYYDEGQNMLSTIAEYWYVYNGVWTTF